MPKTPRYTAKQLMKMLEAYGWYVVSQSGSHRKFKRCGLTETIILPIHSGDLGTGLTKKIMKQAGLE
jgi:predicted RNA binding protein YcfA (HicA-like mRNA interferase family)